MTTTSRTKTMKISSSPTTRKAAHPHKNQSKPKSSISTAKILKPNNKKSHCMWKRIRPKRKKRNPLKIIKRNQMLLKNNKKSKKIKRKRIKSKLAPTSPIKKPSSKSRNSSPTEWKPSATPTTSLSETSSKPRKKFSHSTTWKACLSMSPFTWPKLMLKVWFSTALKATLLPSPRMSPVKFCWQSCEKSLMSSIWLMKSKRRICCSESLKWSLSTLRSFKLHLRRSRTVKKLSPNKISLTCSRTWSSKASILSSSSKSCPCARLTFSISILWAFSKGFTLKICRGCKTARLTNNKWNHRAKKCQETWSQRTQRSWTKSRRSLRTMTMTWSWMMEKRFLWVTEMSTMMLTLYQTMSQYDWVAASDSDPNDCLFSFHFYISIDLIYGLFNICKNNNDWL